MYRSAHSSGVNGFIWVLTGLIQLVSYEGARDSAVWQHSMMANEMGLAKSEVP